MVNGHGGREVEVAFFALFKRGEWGEWGHGQEYLHGADLWKVQAAVVAVRQPEGEREQSAKPRGNMGCIVVVMSEQPIKPIHL